MKYYKKIKSMYIYIAQIYKMIIIITIFVISIFIMFVKAVNKTVKELEDKHINEITKRAVEIMKKK